MGGEVVGVGYLPAAVGRGLVRVENREGRRSDGKGGRLVFVAKFAGVEVGGGRCHCL